MPRSDRYDEDGNYLLPSERLDEDGDYAIDEVMSVANQVVRDMPHDTDQLLRKAALRKGLLEQELAKAPPVRNNPESFASAVLGGQYEIWPPGAPPGVGSVIRNNKPMELARWVGPDIDVKPVGVTVAPVTPANPTPVGEFYAGFVLRPYAILRYGTRGANITVEVDVGAGGFQCTVEASSITVQGAQDNPPHPAESGPIKLTGMLGCYATLKNVPLTRTRYIDANVTVASPLISIPILARGVTVWRANPTQPFTIIFNDSAGNGLYTVNVLANQILEPIPLSPDVFSLTLLGALTAPIRVIFELCL